jgi:hypothetical protein
MKKFSQVLSKLPIGRAVRSTIKTVSYQKIPKINKDLWSADKPFLEHHSRQALIATSPINDLAVVKAKLQDAKALYKKHDIGPCERLCEEIIAQFKDIEPNDMSLELKNVLSDVYYQYGLAVNVTDSDNAIKMQNKALSFNPKNSKAAKEINLLRPKYPVIWPEPDYSYGETDPKYLKEMGLPEDYKPPFSK